MLWVVSGSPLPGRRGVGGEGPYLNFVMSGEGKSWLGDSKKREGARHKPGSVPCCQGAVIYLGRLLPAASCGTQRRGRKKTNPCPFDLAPNRGLPSQHLSMLLVRSYRTLAPLPVPILGPSAVCFCGTILTVARTGRYPASLVFREPGLSSGQPKPTRNRLRYLLPISSLNRKSPEPFTCLAILIA